MGLALPAVMDGLGAALGTLFARVFDYPPDSVSPPAAIVGYPTVWSYDATYRRGRDTAVFPVTVVVGKVSDRASRDVLAPYVTGDGASSVKVAIEADRTLGGAAGSCSVRGAEFATVTIAAVEYLAASFDVEVIG